MRNLLKFSKGGYYFLAVFFVALSLSLVAGAYDDEEDRAASNQSTLPNQLAQTETVTSTKVIILPDSDGDALLDEEDPNPKIAEIYIVKDENKNGIVDSFEE